MSVPLTAEKKRKRDRTTDATQRKAPKLTGANEDVNSTNQTSEVKDTETHVQNTETDPLDVSGAVEHVQSAFAHIKNTKKRHRLEKEARKARKNAAQEPDTDPRHASTTQGLIATFSDHGGTLSRAVPSLISHAEDGAVSQHKPQELAIETTNEALRKPKRKKEQQIDKQHGEADEPNGLDEDEERLRKHSAVLGKFQKATQAPKDKDVVPEQESLEDEAKANVVHELAVPRVDTSTLVQKLSEQDIMPHWLAHPTLVPSDSRTAFQELRLEQQTLQRLAQLGYHEALPVQRALIPLLLPPGVSGASFLPGSEPVLPDLAVSAPTGSGKTIAYLLPIVEALRTKCAHHSVSAVIVVPTRELVAQVAAVAESLAKGSSIRVGTATGSDKLKIEQEKLVHKEQRYDPSRYEQLMDQAKRAFDVPYEDVEERRKYLEDLAKSTASTERYLHEAVECTPDHVLEYRSAVDILVATPGRLLEHITSTLGFNLTHVQWLVIDEADKILDHQNETFLEALNVALRRPRSTLEQTPRERFLRLTNDWDDFRERHVRKVILSATMTRDISKIATLELRRPRLLVVRGSDAATDTARVNSLDSTTSIIQREDNFELPRSLEEFCVPVGDGSEKPLIALQLLTEKIIMDATKKEVATNGVQSDGESSEGDASSESGDSSDSDSDDSSSATSVSSASYSDSESDDEGEETDNSIDSDLERSAAPEDQLDGSLTTESIAQRHTRAQSGGAATVLVFTSSNESAHRLSYLLKTLNPALGSWMTTLTKTKTAKGVNVRSKASEPAIVISTDRAARGIDSFNNRSITHVIQYDVPRSVTSYVHRVGRTARAGRHGKAWTLYTNNEARWFMNDIVKSSALVRETAVEREKIFMPDDELRKRYKTVLGEMREEVFGTK